MTAPRTGRRRDAAGSRRSHDGVVGREPPGSDPPNDVADPPAQDPRPRSHTGALEQRRRALLHDLLAHAEIARDALVLVGADDVTRDLALPSRASQRRAGLTDNPVRGGVR